MNSKKSNIMKHVLVAFWVLVAGLGFITAQSGDCNKDQLRYERLMKNNQMEAAYPIWKSQFTNCPDYKVNIYNHAAEILNPLIEKATGDQKEQYINELISSFDQRLKYYPENKNLYEGEKISYQLDYGKMDSITAMNKLEKVIDNAIANRTILSFNTINSFFNDVINLYYYDKISDDQFVNVYDKTKKAMALNVDIWNEKKASLDEKINGKPEGVKSLDFKEKQVYTNSVENVKFLTEYDSIYTGYFNQYLEMNCTNIARIVNDNYDSNIDNNEWLLQYYYLMQDLDCNSPAYTKIENRVTDIYTTIRPNTNPDNNPNRPARVPNPCAIEATKLYRAGNFSAAADKFKCALDGASSNNDKAQYALNVASMYSKTGSWSNVVTWANKALSYKPGYNKANELIAYAYYKGAGQLSGNSVQQRAAGWVAADYARRAGNRKLAAQYDASAPSSEECFLNGITPGSSYTVGGWIGKTTTARCVKR